MKTFDMLLLVMLTDASKEKAILLARHNDF